MNTKTRNLLAEIKTLRYAVIGAESLITRMEETMSTSEIAIFEADRDDLISRREAAIEELEA